jgi:hypothetical protein
LRDPSLVLAESLIQDETGGRIEEDGYTPLKGGGNVKVFEFDMCRNTIWNVGEKSRLHEVRKKCRPRRRTAQVYREPFPPA